MILAKCSVLCYCSIEFLDRYASMHILAKWKGRPFLDQQICQTFTSKNNLFMSIKAKVFCSGMQSLRILDLVWKVCSSMHRLLTYDFSKMLYFGHIINSIYRQVCKYALLGKWEGGGPFLGQLICQTFRSKSNLLMTIKAKAFCSGMQSLRIHLWVWKVCSSMHRLLTYDFSKMLYFGHIINRIYRQVCKYALLANWGGGGVAWGLNHQKRQTLTS